MKYLLCFLLLTLCVSCVSAGTDPLNEGFTLLANFSDPLFTGLNDSGWSNYTSSNCDMTLDGGINFSVTIGVDTPCWIAKEFPFNRSNRILYRMVIDNITVGEGDQYGAVEAGLGFNNTLEGGDGRDMNNWYGNQYFANEPLVRAVDNAVIGATEVRDISTGEVWFAEIGYNVSQANELCFDYWIEGGVRSLNCRDRDNLLMTDDYVMFRAITQSGGGGTYRSTLTSVWCQGESCPSETAVPPTNSSWNCTAGCIDNTTTWNEGGSVNVTSPTISFTVSTDVNSNGSSRIGENQNYTTMVAADANYKFATTVTTSHAYTIYDTIPFGDSCLYAAFKTTDNDPNVESVNSSSGCLNITRWDYANITLVSPLDNSIQANNQVMKFTYIPTWIKKVENCSLYTNSTGTWKINQTVGMDDNRKYVRKEAPNVGNCDPIINESKFIDGNDTTFSIIDCDPGGTNCDDVYFYVNYTVSTTSNLDVLTHVNITARVSSGQVELKALNLSDLTWDDIIVLNALGNFENVTSIYGADFINSTSKKIQFRYRQSLSGANCAGHEVVSNMFYLKLNQTGKIYDGTDAILNGSENNFTNTFSNGDTLWNVECCNEKSLCNSSVSNYTFTIELNDPPYCTNVSYESNSTDYCQSVRVNATCVDPEGDNITVFFMANATGEFMNYSTINIEGNIYQYTIYHLSAPTNFSYNFVVNDSFGGNVSMPLNIFETTQNTSTTMLYLNGLNQSRKYELNYGPNLTGILNACTNETIWLDITDPNFGINYTSSNTSTVYFNYNTDKIKQFKFSDGTEEQNLSYAAVGDDYFEVQFLGKSTIDKASVSLNGIPYLGSYPSNIIIDSINDSTKDVIIPGEFRGDTANQSTFTNGLSKENLSFVVPGTILRYINISSNVDTSDNSIGYSFPNITMNLSGFAIDEEGFSFEDPFDNESYPYQSNNCQGPLWIWDDFSKGDVSGRWGGDYTVLLDNYIIGTSSASTCTPTCTGDCGQNCRTENIEEFYSQTIALEDRGSTKFKILLDTQYSKNTDGNCLFKPSANSAASTGIKDKTTSTKYSFASSQGTTGDYSKIVTVKVNSGYLEWWENDIFIDSVSFDSTHQYEIYVSLTGKYIKACSGESANANANGYIYWINMSGVAGNGSMDTYGNCSFTYPMLYNTSLTKNITKATLDLKYTEIKSAGSYTLYLSNNNGSTWEKALNGTAHVFSSNGNKLSAKIDLNTTSTDSTIIAEKLKVYVTPGLASGIGIDIGYDGTKEWNYSNNLTNDTSPQFVTLDTSDIYDYITDNCLGYATCAIPIAFSTETSGTVEYSSLNVTQKFTKVFINGSAIEDYLDDKTGQQNVSFKVTSASAGNITVSNLEINYSGDVTYSINAHFYGNENYTASSDNHSVIWRYSPITVNYPSGVSDYNVYPSSVNSKNVQPYGQYLRINESVSTPIWNITIAAKTDPVRIYRWYNPEVDSCLDLYNCLFFNITNCTTVNSTSNQTVVMNNLKNTTEYKLYDFWNLTACDPTNLFLPGNMTFRPMCQDCVKTW